MRVLVKLLLGTLLFFSLHLHAAAKPSTFIVKGISGDVLANVELRLTELTELKPLNAFSEEELAYQINKALQPFGYFNSLIRISNNTISIQPGPRLLISALDIQLTGEGAKNPELLNTLKSLPLTVGNPLLTDNYNKAKLLLTNKAENLGFLHAEFTTATIEIDENKNTSVIRLHFNTGPLYYFGQVQFSPTSINPNLLHRFVPFRLGQPYSTDQVLKFNTALSGSGYFNSVNVKPQITNLTSVPIQVDLKPVSKYAYFLGAGYGTDTGIRGRAGLNIIPINQYGHQFSTQALGSLTQNTVQARYLIPGANPVTDEYNLTGNFSTLNYDTGYSNATLLSGAQRHHTDNFERVLSINGLYEGFYYTNFPNTYQFLLYPKASFNYKKTENKLFSPSGYNLRFNALGSSKSVLSDINMTQFSLDAKAAWMIDPLRLRLYGHTFQGVTNTRDITQLPLSLALLLGGTDNLKAYSFNSIGPGKITRYAGFEIQKETIKDWYLVGFYDVGTVYNPSLKLIQQDIGASIMWVSPVGPIKVGLAQAVDRQFKKNGGLRLAISMGPDL